ncbi:MAG TPA: hypothetical protein VLT16_00585 [Candidatus Limnocylindrales bacterium]|nr:hypothetical protein [Candidatus Limnocylindrales bacterium]
MSATKKPRCDARLKTLPEERQAAIAEYAREHKMVETIEWLRKDGIVTSLAGLSEFLSWWRLQAQFRADESTTEALLEELKKEASGLTDAQLDELGQRTFSLLAIRREDPDTFLQVRGARFKGEIEKEKINLRRQAEARLGEGLKLQREKFQRETCELFLRWAADAKAKKIANATISNAEKIELLGQLMFGENWK